MPAGTDKAYVYYTPRNTWIFRTFVLKAKKAIKHPECFRQLEFSFASAVWQDASQPLLRLLVLGFWEGRGWAVAASQ